jgi:hypothetical protein
VTNIATNGKSTFLADIPSEIRELLDWYEAREVRGSPGPKLTEFANRFLGGMIEDHAIIPPTRCFTGRGSRTGLGSSSEKS